MARIGTKDSDPKRRIPKGVRLCGLWLSSHPGKVPNPKRQIPRNQAEKAERLKAETVNQSILQKITKRTEDGRQSQKLKQRIDPTFVSLCLCVFVVK
jgi:hypothetical protein